MGLVAVPPGFLAAPMGLLPHQAAVEEGGSWGAEIQTLPLTCLLSQGPTTPGCPHPAQRPSPCQGAAFHHLATTSSDVFPRPTKLRKQRGSVPEQDFPRPHILLTQADPFYPGLLGHNCKRGLNTLAPRKESYDQA